MPSNLMLAINLKPQLRSSEVTSIKTVKYRTCFAEYGTLPSTPQVVFILYILLMRNTKISETCFGTLVFATKAAYSILPTDKPGCLEMLLQVKRWKLCKKSKLSESLSCMKQHQEMDIKQLCNK